MRPPRYADSPLLAANLPPVARIIVGLIKDWALRRDRSTLRRVRPLAASIVVSGRGLKFQYFLTGMALAMFVVGLLSVACRRTPDGLTRVRPADCWLFGRVIPAGAGSRLDSTRA